MNFAESLYVIVSSSLSQLYVFFRLYTKLESIILQGQLHYNKKKIANCKTYNYIF